jgi:coenzyme PQQ biosynthesis protein B
VLVVLDVFAGWSYLASYFGYFRIPVEGLGLGLPEVLAQGLRSILLPLTVIVLAASAPTRKLRPAALAVLGYLVFLAVVALGNHWASPGSVAAQLAASLAIAAVVFMLRLGFGRTQTQRLIVAALGLLLLREWQQLSLYSTATVRRVLLETNTVFRLLERMPGQIGWTDMTPGDSFSLTTPEGVNSGIAARLLALPGSLPAYAPTGNGLAADGAVTALILQSPSGKRLAYVPGLPGVSETLLAELSECDTILVDGTFWTDDELVRVEGFGKLARDIGHLPVSGAEGSLAKLSGMPTTRKIYIHLNNTNPMLDEDSPEHRMVLDAGWEIAFDGMDLDI